MDDNDGSNDERKRKATTGENESLTGGTRKKQETEEEAEKVRIVLLDFIYFTATVWRHDYSNCKI